MIAAVLLAASIIFYFAGQRKNPPGFFLDESSIAWNALQIARHGVDEHGVAFPLYFRAFGEYKNPTYIYLLAAVLKVTGPSNLAARRMSAVLGFLACVAIGWIAWKISRSRFVAASTFLTAVLTPMLFEISRLAFEVALYPLATAMFLLSVFNASRRQRWTGADVASISAALVVLTYTYSIGRLFAPLMLALLFLFLTAERRPQLITIAVIFVVLCIVPIAVYNATHHGALTLRFHDVSYVDASQPVTTIVGMEQHYAGNLLPLGMALRGDPNPRHHVPHSGGSILLITFVFAAIGALIVLRQVSSEETPAEDRADTRWWLFVLIGTAFSIVPASLTFDQYHTLRMAPYPVFLIVLSIPALRWLSTRRALATVLLAIGCIQALWFVTIFYRDGGKRLLDFDHGAWRAVDVAVARGIRPIYVDPGLYIHAWWYGAQHGVDASAFVLDIPPRPNAVVISGKGAPSNAVILSDSEAYTVYESR
ncbi:MAG: hypothetical protein NVSMB68_02050 [Thermoanaerobaculia bacterium]